MRGIETNAFPLSPSAFEILTVFLDFTMEESDQDLYYLFFFQRKGTVVE